MQIARTRLSPICWATSATMRMGSPSSSISISMAWLISGSASGGNSTSTTGPAMATTRPSFSSVPARSSAVTVIGSTPLLSRRSLGGHADAEVFAERLLRALLSVVAERLGATDDLGDLGGDGVLSGPVHHAREAHGELVGVVARGLHRPLAGGVLGSSRVEQRSEDARLDVPRQEPLQDLPRSGLELVGRARPFRLTRTLVLVANDLAVQRHQRTDDDLLAPDRDEARIDDLHHVDAPVEERVAHGGGHAAGVLVRRLVAEAGEGGLHRQAAVAEVALPLAADHVDRRVAPHFAMLRDLALGRAQPRRVVRAAQAAVGGDHDVADAPDLRPRHQEGALDRAAGVGEVVDDLGDLVAVRNRRLDPGLSPHDAAGRDELHGARDLLGRLHAPDASAEDALLTAGHTPLTSIPRSLRRQGLVGLGLAEGLTLQGFDRGVAVVAGRLEHRLEIVDGLLELGLFRELPRVADRGQQVGMTGAEEVVELALEAPDVLDREVVEVAVRAGEDRDDLELDRHRRVQRLLEQLREPVATVELGLRHPVELGPERRERFEVTELGEVDLECPGHRLHRLDLRVAADA